MRGILENIPRYTKETNNKQTLVINETDELAKETRIIGILFTMEKILKNTYWTEMTQTVWKLDIENHYTFHQNLRNNWRYKG